MEENLADVMKKLNIVEGFGVGLEMSGNGKAFNQMIDSMMHGGKIALLGILATGIGIDWVKVIFNGLTLKGIYGREMYETWYKTISMLQSGLDVSPVITHHFPAAEFQKAFDVMRKGESGKVILDWS
jgi:threonine 3-dehydrogenase